ncbi:hypothetical protein Trydic_g6036 [Trypoxylus dichotomus]
MIELINEENIDLLLLLFNNIYKTGNIPPDWLEFIFEPLHKKHNARKHNHYKLINLMSHALKVLLKITQKRIYNRYESIISSEQFRSRNGLGEKEAPFSLQILSQKCDGRRRGLHICFIDFERAFDRINHDKLFEFLEEIWAR